MKTAILTDTPVKNQLEEEEKLRNEKKAGKLKKATRKLSLSDENSNKYDEKEKKLPKKVRKRKRVTISSSSESEDEDCVCLICMESYMSSKPGQEWIQCINCKKWAHISCVRGNKINFVCQNCNSDIDVSSECE